MGKIRFNNMIFYAHHGYYQAERELGQKFQVDMELDFDFDKAIKSDDLKDTVNFETAYQKVHHIFSSYKFTLLETLADRIAIEILEKFPINSILIRVRKPNVPLNGFMDNVEVEYFRQKSPNG
ncbi:MAG: dihydroneopterin aldolase [Calditrichia bacterium]|nr:dihydroneopterin aldolase [Calditrichia bacterium]